MIKIIQKTTIKSLIKRLSAIFLTAVIVLSLWGCGTGGSAIDYFYFNTAIHVETHDSPLSKESQDKLNNLFKTLDNQFSVNKENSLIHAFNMGKKGDVFNLNEHQKYVFIKAKECYEDLSSKMFNPATYPLSEIWQFTEKNKHKPFTPPDQQTISETLTKVDFNNAILDEEKRTLTKGEDFTMLDFGGILKGYASDKAKEILLESGHTKGYISLGGSSLVLLNTESLSIRHPRPIKDNKGNIVKGEILRINTKDNSILPISSSGDYEKYHDYNGKRYSHIINSKTGYPSDTGICSVTITGIDGVYADALSTAVCVFSHTPENKGTSPVIAYMKSLVEKFPSAIFYAVYHKDGIKEILTNEKENKNFVLLDDSYTIYNF